MKTIIKGTILGAIIAYAWMTFSWMGLTFWHEKSFEHFKSEAGVTTAILRNIDKGGVYIMFPQEEGIKKGDGKKTSHEQADLKKAPPATKRPLFMMAAVDLNPMDHPMPLLCVYSFLSHLIVAFFFTLFTKVAALRSYFGRLCFITGMSIAGSIMVLSPFWIWWRLSPIFIGMQALDFVIAWFLAGLAIAAVVKRVFKN